MDQQPIGFAKTKINSLNEKIISIAQMELQKPHALPEFHKMGAGTALMSEIKRLAVYMGPDYIWLDTHISNESAIRFYEKNGFSKIGKQYFTIGSQTFEYYVMGLPLGIEITNER